LVNLCVNEMDSFSIRLLTLVILLSLNIVFVWLLYLELNINLRHFFQVILTDVRPTPTA
jgi:hypothetical protein